MCMKDKLNQFSPLRVNIFKTVVLHALFASVAFTVLDLQPAWGNLSSCLSIYNSRLNSSGTLDLIGHISKKLQEDPFGFPTLTISESLLEYIRPIIEKYQTAMTLTGESQAINPIKLTVTSADAALVRFYELSARLDTELKRTSQNRKNLVELSQDLKSCFGILMQCKANIKESLASARNEVQANNITLQESASAVEELKLFKAKLPTLSEIPHVFHEEIKRAIDSQIYLLEISLPLVLKQQIESQTQLLNLAQAQIPALVAAQSNAAILEASGAIGIGALNFLGTSRLTDITRKPRNETKAQSEFIALSENSNPTALGESFLAKVATHSIFQLFNDFKIAPLDSKAEPQYLSIKDVQRLAQAYMEKLFQFSPDKLRSNYFDLYGVEKNGMNQILSDNGFLNLFFLTGNLNHHFYLKYLNWIKDRFSHEKDNAKLELAALEKSFSLLGRILPGKKDVRDRRRLLRLKIEYIESFMYNQTDRTAHILAEGKFFWVRWSVGGYTLVSVPVNKRAPE